MVLIRRCFNPRTHEGCDGQFRHPFHYRLRVSIHAPTKGATSCGCSQASASYCFNPRTHEGCDPSLAGQKLSCRVSIHAPTKGATSYGTTLPTTSIRFQSTHPRRVRRTVTDQYIAAMEFQSTHPRRVRPVIALVAHLSKVKFQSTHPRRVRPQHRTPPPHSYSVSIHAPTKGATSNTTNAVSVTIGFNPRTHEGCDGINLTRPAVISVSIHAPTKGAT